MATIIMNGITDPRVGAPDRYTLTEEMIIWLLFSVAVPLFYFVLTLVAWWLVQHNVNWVELLKSGGLVTYASTLASKTAGEYFKTISGKTLMTPFCVFGLICILVLTAGVYGMLLSLGTSIPQPPKSSPAVSADRLAEFSWIITVAAVVYGFCFTLYAKSKERQS